MLLTPLNFVSEMFCFANFQIKEQKVAVDELSKLKKNRVGRRNVTCPEIFKMYFPFLSNPTLCLRPPACKLTRYGDTTPTVFP